MFRTLTFLCCSLFCQISFAGVIKCGQGRMERQVNSLKWSQVLSYQAREVKLPIGASPEILGKVCIGQSPKKNIEAILYRDNMENEVFGTLPDFDKGQTLIDKRSFPIIMRPIIRSGPLVIVRTQTNHLEQILIHLRIVTNVTDSQFIPARISHLTLTLDASIIDNDLTPSIDGMLFDHMELIIDKSGGFFSTTFFISEIDFFKDKRPIISRKL